MSFASQAREEIARRSLQKDCCVCAAAYGIACFAKYFDASGLVLQTEQELTTQVAAQLFARCGVQGEIVRKERPSGVVYEFSIRAPEQVARMHELFGTTGTETSLQLSLIHISEPTRRTPISYAVFCLKKKKKQKNISEPTRPAKNKKNLNSKSLKTE